MEMEADDPSVWPRTISRWMLLQHNVQLAICVNRDGATTTWPTLWTFRHDVLSIHTEHLT
jgi:hypothetical protein